MSGPISRILYPSMTGGGHLSRRRIAPPLKRPTQGIERAARGEKSKLPSPALCLALLPMGFASRRSYLSRWWSLTPPFHSHQRGLDPRGDLLSVALGRRVTSPGDCPASRSMEFGLSSWQARACHAAARPTHQVDHSTAKGVCQTHSLRNDTSVR